MLNHTNSHIVYQVQFDIVTVLKMLSERELILNGRRQSKALAAGSKALVAGSTSQQPQQPQQRLDRQERQRRNWHQRERPYIHHSRRGYFSNSPRDNSRDSSKDVCWYCTVLYQGIE